MRDRVNAVLADLPRDADPPVIEKIEPDATPVLSVVLSGPAPIRDLTEFADKKYRRALESVLGVGQVRVIGGRARQVNVVVDSNRLSGLDLTVANVVRALQTQNVQVPGGKVEQGVKDLTLRTYGRVTTPEELGSIPVAVRNGEPVRVSDVATIRDTEAEVESLASLNGTPAVVLQVRKQSGTNTIEVVERLKERIDALGAQLPGGWKTDLVRDQSEYVVAAVDAVKEHLVLGSIFAALVVFAFLRKLRPTLIAAVSIPASLIATFAAIDKIGYSLNVITLLALTLAVGIVVDDAVVVLEIIFRHMEKRRRPGPGRHRGNAGNRDGRRRHEPLAHRRLPPRRLHGRNRRALHGVVRRDDGLRHRRLHRRRLHADPDARLPLAQARRRRGGGELARARLLPRRREGVHVGPGVVDEPPGSRRRPDGSRPSLRDPAWESHDNFLPVDDEGQFDVIVRAPEGSSIETTRTILESIAARIRPLPGVHATLLTIGEDPQRTQNLGSVYVKLASVHDRKESQFAIMDRVRREILPQYARLNLRSQVSPVNAFGAGRTPRSSSGSAAPT